MQLHGYSYNWGVYFKTQYFGFVVSEAIIRSSDSKLMGSTALRLRLHYKIKGVDWKRNWTTFSSFFHRCFFSISPFSSLFPSFRFSVYCRVNISPSPSRRRRSWTDFFSFSKMRPNRCPNTVEWRLLSVEFNHANTPSPAIDHFSHTFPCTGIASPVIRSISDWFLGVQALTDF